MSSFFGALVASHAFQSTLATAVAVSIAHVAAWRDRKRRAETQLRATKQVHGEVVYVKDAANGRLDELQARNRELERKLDILAKIIAGKISEAAAADDASTGSDSS